MAVYNINQKIEKIIERLVPMDDAFFRALAEYKEFCEEFLRTVLDDDALEVLQNIPQRRLNNQKGRYVILDAYCKLSTNEHVLIEVQKGERDDQQRRLRYNASLFTVNTTKAKTDFKDIKNICCILVSDFDPFNGDKAIYHVNRVVQELGITADNGIREIYINSANKDGSKIARLMEIFVKDDAYDKKSFPTTSMLKHMLKHTKEGKNKMTALIREVFKDEFEENERKAKAIGEKIGEKKGEKKGVLSTLYNLIKKGRLTIEEAAQDIGMSIDELLAGFKKYKLAL